MRSGVVRGRDVPLITDVAIALVLVGTVTFFVVVMEYCVGRGELTHAQLLLLGANVRIAHSTDPTIDDKKSPRDNKKSKNGKRWSTETAN